MLLAFKVLLLLPFVGLCLVTRAHSRSLVDVGVEGCGKCEEDFCPKSEDECLHGLMQDPCGCCRGGVCVLAEREKCFSTRLGATISESGMRKYGTCGEYMDCVSRTDLTPNTRPESLCVCKHSEPVCGSDNTTYDSICDMASAEESLRHYGPCLKKPTIVSGPQASNTYEGSTFALDCEAKGFPVPSIAWEFQSYASVMETLPGDDPAIVVHSRGGPENYMLTSWLQIEALRKNDSGIYICVARNSEGEDRSVTSVQVSAYSP